MNATRVTMEEVEFLATERAATPWPLWWSGVWTGALAALAVVLVTGLVGLAVGAHQAVPGRVASWGELRLITLIFSVGGAFFSFVVGGWVAARIGGIRRAETAMLHGAVVWLLAVPLLILLVSLGATALVGDWYAGLGGTPVWGQAGEAGPVAVEPEAARAARNAALAAVTSLLLGLVGAVLGGWLASDTPMQTTARTSRVRR
jgi:hypothetical protein